MFSLYLFILLNGCVYDDTKQDNHEHIYYKQPKKHDSNTQSNTCPFTNNKNSCGASTSPPPPIIKTPPSKNQHLIDNTTFSDMEFCRRCATKKCAFIHEKNDPTLHAFPHRALYARPYHSQQPKYRRPHKSLFFPWT